LGCAALADHAALPLKGKLAGADGDSIWAIASPEAEVQEQRRSPAPANSRNSIVLFIALIS
jgi:hypothetical protein